MSVLYSYREGYRPSRIVTDARRGPINDRGQLFTLVLPEKMLAMLESELNKERAEQICNKKCNKKELLVAFSQFGEKVIGKNITAHLDLDKLFKVSSTSILFIFSTTTLFIFLLANGRNQNKCENCQN